MKKKTTILLFLLILTIHSSNINVQITAEENNYRPTSLELTPHDPIEITSDIDFEVFPGTGTEENPYVIEGYSITTTDARGIYIIDTTKYFTIRNCYVDADLYDISIWNVADGTATVINNTGSNIAIMLVDSGSSTVINNTCSNNYAFGIYLSYSDSSTVINNTGNNNFDGIVLASSDCIVTYNLLQENEYYGILLDYSSDNSLIHHNNFVDNNLGGSSQAFDDGTNNYWYDPVAQEGNYWSDWSEIGSYSVDGSANSVDLFPLSEPVIVEYPQFLLLTLLLSIVPLLFIRIISKKTKKEKSTFLPLALIFLFAFL